MKWLAKFPNRGRSQFPHLVIFTLSKCLEDLHAHENGHIVPPNYVMNY